MPWNGVTGAYCRSQVKRCTPAAIEIGRRPAASASAAFFLVGRRIGVRIRPAHRSPHRHLSTRTLSTLSTLHRPTCRARPSPRSARAPLNVRMTCAAAVENLERHLLRRLLQPVGDLRRVRRARRVGRLEQIRVRRRRHRRAVLPQRRDVVEDVEAAAVRRDRDVARLDPDVVHRRVRQPVLQRLPVIAVVERDVEAVLRAGVEQAAPRRILADDVRVVVRPECR